MPVVNRIAAFAEDMTAWRRHLHQNPELGFDCHGTARFVADRLRDFGVDEVHEGIATSPKSNSPASSAMRAWKTDWNSRSPSSPFRPAQSSFWIASATS